MNTQTCGVVVGDNPTIESVIDAMYEFRRKKLPVPEPIRLTRDQFAKLKNEADALGMFRKAGVGGFPESINGVRIEIVKDV